MLKNKYEEIIVGQGVASLLRGIISAQKGKSVLLIDDDRFSVDYYPMLFISELEVLAIQRLGMKYDIPELLAVRDFLTHGCMDLNSDKKMLTLGASPLENFKEVLRKFPELINPDDLDLLYAEDEEDFNRYFLEQLQIFESQNYEAALRSKVSSFALTGPRWVRNVYQRFNEFLNKSYEELKSLKYQSLMHLLGISFEEKFKKRLLPPDLPFYFFRLFSPIYRMRDYLLCSQLRRRLTLFKGDYKKSRIQFWQFFHQRFENLLLESFEGVISGENVLFFSHVPAGMSFSLRSTFKMFKKYEVSDVAGHHDIFPFNHLSLFTNENKLGTDRPYEAYISDDGKEFQYHWSFPDMPGSKTTFYYQEMLEDFQKIMGEECSFFAENSSQESKNFNIDLRSIEGPEKHFLEPSLLKRIPFHLVHEGNEVKGLEYWGPFRYQYQGFLVLLYGLEIQ